MYVCCACRHVCMLTCVGTWLRRCGGQRFAFGCLLCIESGSLTYPELADQASLLSQLAVKALCPCLLSTGIADGPPHLPSVSVNIRMGLMFAWQAMYPLSNLPRPLEALAFLAISYLYLFHVHFEILHCHVDE